MNGEKFARVLAGLAVLAVAVVAFIVSFAHIETLALASGYSIATARLLPFSVDGLILASSTALLTGARPGLARAGLVLGIVATLGANVAAGAEFGVVGALVNAWPAVAFIVASEILLSTVRAARDLPSAEGAAGTVAAEAPTAPVLPLEAVAGDVPAVPADVLPDVPLDTPVTVASVPQDATEDTSLPVAAPVPDTPPAASLRAVPRRTPLRTPPAKPKSAEKMFAVEIQRGELPSLREVMRRAGCGQPRARQILSELQEVMREKAA